MFHYLIVGYRIFFVFLYEHLGFALAILLTSLISSFLVKPIARVIMKFVKREQAYEAVLDPLVAEINASDNSGADKQFLLQDLYRRYGYSPIYATRKILPMFVQAPLLFLTYYMLEGATVLNGVPFFCFADLGEADALLPLGINLLPFLMTGINIVAIFATVTFTRQDRIQALVVALLFLWLLYSASSALMIYWTLNNLFTCLKTLAEEKGEGARLIGRRLAFLCSPKTHREWIKFVREQPVYVYAIAALVCWNLALYAFFSPLPFSKNAFMRSFFSCNAPFLLSILFLLWVGVEKKLRFFLHSAFLLSILAMVLFLVDCKFTHYLDQVIQPLPGVMLSLKYHVPKLILVMELGLFGLFWIYSMVKAPKSQKNAFSVLEFSVFTLCIIGLACHYVSSNPILGITASSFFFMSLYMVAVFWGLVAVGSILVFRYLSCKAVVRVAFLFSVVFYVMPFFAKESGWLSPGQNAWLFCLLLAGLGILFTSFWKKKSHAVTFFVALAAIGFFAGSIKTTLLNSRASKGGVSDEAKALASQQESFSKLDGLSVVNPVNIYVLVFDGWPNANIGDYYGIYNPLPDLEQRGFTAYPKSYMPESHTAINMSLFFDIFRDTNLPIPDIVTGRAKCLRFLYKNNYKMSYLVDNGFLARHSLPLEGAFFYPKVQSKIETVLFNGIRRGILPTDGNSLQSVTPLQRRNATLSVLSQTSESPQFVYSHVGPGHVPWGIPVLRSYDEERLEAQRVPIEKGKSDIFAFLDAIPDWDQSLIVVMSDHGMGLMQTDNTSEATAFLNYNANMLAVKWPKGYTPVMDVSFTPNVLLEAMICVTGDQSLSQFKQKGYLYDRNPLKKETPGREFAPFEDGVMLEGSNEGRNLFDVAEEELQKRFQSNPR